MGNKIYNDKFAFGDEKVGMPESKGGLWARTEVIGGYGDITVGPDGKSTLGEQCFGQHNMVTIGGVEYTMEKLFGVKGNQFTVPTLYDSAGVGLPNSGAMTDAYMVPGGNKVALYRHGHQVQLFGIGITGTAENDITVHPVDYRENSITMSKLSSDGAKLNGTMVPFRQTAEALNATERLTYFGKKTNAGVISYYLKKFQTDPTIKHIWKTGDDVESEVSVSSSDVWTNNVGTNAIETFTEMILVISKKDVKEYFIGLDQEDRARITTIALFNGRYVKTNDPTDFGDYEDVRMFSKLNIPTEHLSLNKDLKIIYRVYGS